MNPVFEGKIRTKTPKGFRGRERRLQAMGFCWHYAGAKFVGNDPSKRIMLSSVIPNGGRIYGVLVRSDPLGRRIILARTVAEFEQFPGETYLSMYQLKAEFKVHLEDSAAARERDLEIEARLDEKTARLAAGDQHPGRERKLKEDMARRSKQYRQQQLMEASPEEGVPRTRKIPLAISKIRVHDGAEFKAKELLLVDAGAAWMFNGKLLPPGKKSGYPVPGTSQDPYGIYIVFHMDTDALRLSIIHDKKHWESLNCRVHASAHEALKAIYWGRPIPPFDAKGKTLKEVQNELNKVMTTAPYWIGVDLANLKNYEVPVMKPYTLKARASEQSIDFYEVAEALNRSNPIAFLTAGSKEGYVLVHKQLLRQAEGKRNSIKLPRKASETDQLRTLRLAEVTSKLAVPGGRQSYPWKFGNAFAFRVDSPSEFPTWKKWAQHVRQARWNVEEREYKVTFPEV